MAEPVSTEAYRWAFKAILFWLPERLLRWRWKDARVLEKLRAMFYEQAPAFRVRSDRQAPVLETIGFAVFNMSPMRLKIVGANLRVSVDSMDWFTYDQRLSSPHPLEPLGLSGMHFKRDLVAWQVEKLRANDHDWILIRVSGHLILESKFGELRREVHSDVVATIDRD